MRKTLSIALAFLFCITLFARTPMRAQADDRYLEINETNFPDAAFRQWIIDNLEVSGDEETGYYMTEAQVGSVMQVSCPDCGIASLTGIEYFTAMNRLACRNNKLIALNLSSNTALVYLDCSHNEIRSLDVGSNTKLKWLYCHFNQLQTLDVSSNTALDTLNCGSNNLTTLNLANNTELTHLQCYTNRLTNLDVDTNTKLEYFACNDNTLTDLDVSKNTALTYLLCQHNHIQSLSLDKNTALTWINCYGNELNSLDVTKNTALQTLNAGGNHLCTLNVSKNTELTQFFASGQTVLNQSGKNTNGTYTFDMSKLMSKNEQKLVSFPDTSITMNSAGIVKLPGEVESFSYRYNASGDPSNGDIELPELPVSVHDAEDEDFMLDVTVYLTYESLPAFDGTVEWNNEDVEYNGKTPYVIANGMDQTPRFTVKTADGKTVGASHYTYQYRENKNAGTAYVIITFKDIYSGTARGWFKIYLPATDYTMVENREDGVYLEWKPVEGADGYVIYRRAWNLQSAGWTSFVRWNNTKDLHWTDKTVYAGTRYQYGIKAYFDRRVDPVSGAEIGGNVGDNYNLGQVGPLKTTVRITTRTLNSVTGGSKQITVKWSGSNKFTGYEIQIATDAAFTKNVKTVTITNAAAYETTIKSLKAKTTYYVRVRSYHVFEGMTYYGGWSNVKNAKTR
ncbi:MAG: fibronectin type III domain-containing protein [Clostridia bacterium]|nr:fibronectin type III domain-containing protein [Clostridia bacterium]